MAIMRIKYGETVEIALKKPNGELKPSNVPGGKPEVMFTLCGDERWFAPQQAAEEIVRLGIKPFEAMRVTHEKRGGLPYYKIEPIPGPLPETHTEQQLRDSLDQQQRAQTLSKAAPAAAPSGVGPTLVSTEPQANRSAQTELSQLLGGCMIAAIDAAVIARDYAHSKGLTVSLSEQSIQDLTSTLMIHIQKMADLECRYDVKGAQALARVQSGGRQWRQ